MEKLLSQENRVIEQWTSKKKRLDQCQQFRLFEQSAQQSLNWLDHIGEAYLKDHCQEKKLGNSKEEIEQLLREHNEFKGTAKVSL